MTGQCGPEIDNKVLYLASHLPMKIFYSWKNKNMGLKGLCYSLDEPKHRDEVHYRMFIQGSEKQLSRIGQNRPERDVQVLQTFPIARAS